MIHILELKKTDHFPEALAVAADIGHGRFPLGDDGADDGGDRQDDQDDQGQFDGGKKIDDLSQRTRGFVWFFHFRKSKAKLIKVKLYTIPRSAAARVFSIDWLSNL